jgi:hypothetical protein
MRLIVNNVVERGNAISIFSNLWFFNELRCSCFKFLQAQFAPTIGIDNYEPSVYLCLRRRLKGWAKLKSGQSKVSWVISSLG